MPAKKTKLSVEIGLKDKQAKILAPQIHGGKRRLKRSERWLGSKWTLTRSFKPNKYGNIAGGKITQILSVLGRHPDRYSNTTARSRKRNKKLPNYFMIPKGSKSHLHPGVYQRFKTKIKPVLIFPKKEPRYRKRFPFDRVAIATFKKKFNNNFKRAFAYAMRTAK